MFHQKQKPWLPEICQIRKCHCHITLDFLGKLYQSTICLRLSGTFYLKILFIADKRECSPCIVQPNLWIVHRHQGTQQGMQVEGFSIIFHNQSLMNIQLLNYLLNRFFDTSIITILVCCRWDQFCNHYGNMWCELVQANMDQTTNLQKSLIRGKTLKKRSVNSRV